MAEGKIVVYVQCRACRRLVTLPYAALRGYCGRALYRRLRCTDCGALGQAEVRVTWVLTGAFEQPDGSAAS
ncbi:MAG: hypothetical protein QM699_07840 [Amaricoccus sp.]|uniref:hypothetical protein n=1 Tax=Amaricoccus sp. TaxID=1872485 RepID=UPI0039E57275